MIKEWFGNSNTDELKASDNSHPESTLVLRARAYSSISKLYAT